MHKGLTFKLYWIENFSIPRLRLVTHTHEEIRRLRNAVRYRRSQKTETGSDCHLETLCQKAYGFSSPWRFPSYHDTLHARRVSRDNFVFRKSDISVNFSRLDSPSFSRGYCSTSCSKSRVTLKLSIVLYVKPSQLSGSWEKLLVFATH